MNADPDPDPAAQINADPDTDPDPKPCVGGKGQLHVRAVETGVGMNTQIDKSTITKKQPQVEQNSFISRLGTVKRGPELQY